MIDNILTIENGIITDVRDKTIASVKIPDNIEGIGERAFKDCINLNSINIPGSVKKISALAFSGCLSLKEIILNEGIREIYGCAFCSTAIKRIMIPKTVEIIVGNVFSNCKQLTHVIVASGNKRFIDIDGVLIYKTTNKKLSLYLYPEGRSSNYVVPSGINILGSSAFQGTDIQNVLLPDSLERIESSCFSGNENLHSIRIPKNVKSIGKGAFEFSGIEEIFLDSESIKMCINAFSFCYILRLHVKSKNPKNLNVPFGAFRGALCNTTLLVPKGTKDLYKDHKIFGYSGEIIEE